MSQPGGPDWSALTAMLGDLKQAWSNVGDTQRRLLAVTGTAWSPDRLVKVVVGPRGQLVDLDIDPRVFRTPDSKALAAAILAASRLAVEDVAAKVREIVEATLPSDLRAGRFGRPGSDRMLYGHDADARQAGGDDD